MNKPLLALTLGLALPAFAWAAAHYDFGRSSNFRTGSDPEAVAIGDVDGDGQDDVVLVTGRRSDPENDNHVWIYGRQGSGALALAGRFPWASDSHVRDATVALHDLDGDGTDEILLGTPAGLSVYVEDGAGGFLHQSYPQSLGCVSLAVLDADGDGAADVYCHSPEIGGRVFLGDGNAAFPNSRAAGTAAIYPYGDSAAADMDGDGDPDLVVLAYPGFAILHNDGQGGFSSYTSYSGLDAHWEFSTLAVGDFNGDGRNDVAAAVSANQPESKVGVYLQSDSGRLAPPQAVQTLDLARDMVARDLDGDGDDDLVVNHGFDGIGHYVSSGGTFGSEQLTPGLNVPNAGDTLALGDVDGDGCPDAAAASHSGLAVFAGKCIAEGELPAYALQLPVELPTATIPNAVAIADFDGNGSDDLLLTGRSPSVDGARTFLYLGGPGNQPLADALGSDVVALADFDRDGRMDLAMGVGTPVGLLRSIGAGGLVATGPELVPGTYEDCDYIAAGDVDLDGIPDVVCHARMSARAYAFPIDGDGRFTNESLELPTFSQAGIAEPWVRGIALADFNGDGRDDLVALTTVEGDTTAALYLFPHDGLDGFGAPTIHAANGTIAGGVIATGDFNDDGLADAAISSGGAAQVVSLFLQHQDGGFDPPIDIGAPMGASVALGVDLDRNGADDLVAFTNNTLLRYMQGGGLVDSTWIGDEVFISGGGAERTVAAGDLDQDGCVDVVAKTYWHAVQWVRSACAAGGVPDGGDDGDDDGDNGTGDPPGDAIVDFDGDGRSDILWRNHDTGANTIWPGGAHAQRTRMPRVSTDWRIAGVGDVDGDGRDDIVWRHATRGANAIWLGGDAVTQPVVPRVTNLAWHIEAVGDFDGDGKDDLFWRNVENGRNVIWKAGRADAQRKVTGVRNTSWHVVAAADFDGDGVDDLLWRNSATGANTAWRSANAVGPHDIADLPPGWHVVAAADVDGDGRADIVWRHQGAGRTETWLGGDAVSRQPVRDVASGWDAAAVADYDGDGFLDLLWRHGSTGRNVVWRSFDHASHLAVTDVTDTAWIVAP